MYRHKAMPSFTLFDIKAGNATVNTMAKTHRMVLIIFFRNAFFIYNILANLYYYNNIG